MSKYFPLHVHSHFSLLDGLSKPASIAKRIVELGLEGSALTDHGSLSGSVAFSQAMQKEKLKSILGCELYISDQDSTLQMKENRKLNHQVVLAKNLKGWRALLKITSDSNSPQRFYHNPRIDWGYLETNSETFKGDLVTFSGHLGSGLAHIILDEDDKLYVDWEARALKFVRWQQEVFGADNFFVEIQLMDQDNNPVMKMVGEALRAFAIKFSLPKVATPDAHYARHEDAQDQHVLLCSNMGTTFAQVNSGDSWLKGFFQSTNFHIPSFEEMQKVHTQDELDNTLAIANMCDNYSILSKPILPPFECPMGMSQDEYLRHLCREGWKKKIAGKVQDEAAYAARVKMELEVLQGAGLSSYFNIVEDILQYIRKNLWLPGPGRGSAAGSLVAYLIGITSIDPMPYDLLFERFYNGGRNTADRVSMPDVDMDVPVAHREDVINYMRDKYGHNQVAQIISFQTIKGKGALKSVLRAHGGVSFNEMNSMTESIPEDNKIADELQEMKEETGESSIIRWALENRGSKFKDWCEIDEKGNLDGPMAKRFAQAIRLEGTKSAASRHASGVVIAPTALDTVCPMVLDSSDNLVAGLEMNDLEAVGMIKFDILGVAFLDKVMGVKQILETGYIQ